VVPAGTYTLSLGPAGEDLNAGGDLDLLGEVTVAGDGREATNVDAGGLDRGLEVHAGVQATLTVRGGMTSVDGGGIRTAGALTLRGVDVVGNQGLAGGGIAVDTTAGLLDAQDVSVRENRASTGGGGINVFDGEVALVGGHPVEEHLGDGGWRHA
jgi:hypothetical protein